MVLGAGLLGVEGADGGGGMLTAVNDGPGAGAAGAIGIN